MHIPRSAIGIVDKLAKTEMVPVFLIYTWRTVAWELTNWKKAVLSIANFLGYLLKLALALIFHFIGDPVTALIRYIETFLYSAQSIYSGIVAYAPVQELTVIIILSSAVLAIAESTVPGSVNSQPYLLTLAGLLGFWVVGGSIPTLLFWLLLLGMYCFSRFIKKRDNVSAALPFAAVAVAVGEPWVRGLAMAFYLALAISQHSKSPKENAEMEVPASGRGPPLPLLGLALAIGIHVAAKWVRYRHLTWMVA
ncbi:embryo defective 1923 isoform X2 [Tasmannia lanceolata]|uniref:embryo defective 1923 isoform X2 n=1 Tax=Tasmannia lanceolata TaxID=3420 RepID=UPI004064BDC5